MIPLINTSLQRESRIENSIKVGCVVGTQIICG